MQLQPLTALTNPVLRLLLADTIDYAGLFPPANLAMEQVVRHYQTYRASDDQWALGRLVIPANRLEELARILRSLEPQRDEPWLISALLGPEPASDVGRIETFNVIPDLRAHVDSAEGRLSDPQTIQSIAGRLGSEIALYCELPLDGQLESTLAVIGAAGARSKIRMGGVTPDLFPDPAIVIRFLNATIAARVPFKATAGLHHPFRSVYPLTYEPHAPQSPMYGFLNILLATGAILTGAGNDVATGLLLEENVRSFQFDNDGLAWEGAHFNTGQLHQIRKMFCGFGSCSFREPIDDLRALSLLS